MNTTQHFDLMRDLLDHELVDSHGVSCGMVDDLELDLDSRTPAVIALLVGPGAWQPRLPALARLLLRKTGRQRIRVAFDEVAEIAEVIRLKSPATQLGLGVVDRRAGRWLKRIADV